MSSSSTVRFLGLIAVCFAFLLASYSNTMTLGSQSDRDLQQQCIEQEEVEDVMEGGVRDVEGFENDAEYEQLARFAVDEHNKKQNAALEFVRLVKAKEQVVAGVMHHLTVEVKEAGKKKLYEAKVWVQAWLNSKQLHEFNPLGDSSSTITPADLGAKRDGHESGWRTVPPHDPVVKDAAHHAVKTIQQRSNSLAPYELLEIVLAKAEVIENLAKFDLLLKLKRGSKEEKYKVEVHKNLEGTFHLNQMQEQL